MKKNPVLLSLLTASLGNIAFLTSTSSAMYQENDTTWWTVEELLDYSNQVDAEREVLCHGNQDCEMEYYLTMYEESDKYRALDNFLQAQFWVTSINPGAETIKVLFFDEDMMLRRIGIKEHLEIEHLYIGWFEEWNGQIYNYNHDSFTNGSTPGSHPLYDSTVEDLSVIVPWQEVELSVAGGNVIDNTSGKTGYAIFAKNNMFNAQGSFDYSSCLRAADYAEGVECKIMISGDQWVTYLPPRETIIEFESEPEPEPELGPESESKPEIELKTEPTTSTDSEQDTNIEPESTSVATEPLSESNIITTEESTDSSLKGINSFLEKRAIVSINNSNQSDLSQSITPVATRLTPKPSLKSPETGSNTSSGDTTTEFSWWFLPIFILSISALMWLFWPESQNRHKKHQKSNKIKKKS